MLIYLYTRGPVQVKKIDIRISIFD